MKIGVGMLIFALIDSGVAFFLVYYVTKAKFGGEKKAIARVLSALLGTLTFMAYFAAIVWFNTYPITASDAVKQVVYWAPFVLSALMLVLIHLSKPPKSIIDQEEEAPEEEENEENEEENEESSDVV